MILASDYLLCVPFLPAMLSKISEQIKVQILFIILVQQIEIYETPTNSDKDSHIPVNTVTSHRYTRLMLHLDLF